MARKRIFTRKPIWYKSALSVCLAILLALQTVTFTASANGMIQPEEPEFTAPESSVTEAVYDDPLAGPMFMPLAIELGDKTAVIAGANSPFPVEVKQAPAAGQPEVAVASGGTIQGRLPFTLSLSNIKVPVKGDNQTAPSETIIQKGDTVIFDKETYFPMVDMTATGTKIIMVDNLKVATVVFAANNITITFDGDDTFFNGAKRDVIINLTTTAKADVSSIPYGEQQATQIFNAGYNISNPALTPAYSIAITPQDSVKPGQYAYVNLNKTSFVKGKIMWKVDVAAFDRDDTTIPLPLDGKMFFDDLSQGGTYQAAGVYVEGSFTVDGDPATPVYANGALSYTFPEESTPEAPRSRATITFETWIPKEWYYYEYHTVPGGDNGVKMDTIAKLKDESDTVLVLAGSYRVNIYPDWIQQTGAVSKRGNDTLVTWTIDVNKNYSKQGLKNFTITDALPAGLSFESASYQLWDTATTGWSDTKTQITPTGENGDTYSIPDGENSPVRLVIVSKVDSDSSFTNRARVNWTLESPSSGLQDNDAIVGNDPSTVSDGATVTVGAHTFTKAAQITQTDFNNAMIGWTVNLTPQYEVPNMVVYDLLVHGASIDLSQIDEPEGIDAATLTQLENNLDTRVNWQQYKEGSFATNDGLTLEVIPLKRNDIHVADLLKVTGYTDRAASFSFRSVLTNPDKFAGQRHQTDAIKTNYNRAFLFEGDTYVTRVDQYGNYYASMLTKGMLFASKPLKSDGTPENVTPNNVNSAVSNDSNEAWTISAYDRVSKTVTFRLAVNMPGFNTDELAKDGGSREASDIRLVDTLPEGWEFVPFSGEKDFELWKGYSTNDSGYGYGVTNNAQTLIEPGTSAHVVNFSHSGNVGTFTFSKLESPYVILVKARPTAAAMSADLAAGKTKHEGFNTAELKIKWGGVEKVNTEARKVIVPLSSLGKTVTKPASGIQEWTVNYAPSFAITDGVYLQDTLGAGLKLREDINGDLSLTAPDMAVYRATMTPSGALEREGAALDLTGSDPEVKVELQKSEGNPTKLIFKLKNPNQFYQLVYQTESSGMAVGTVGNKIELLGGENLPAIEASSTIALDANDVSGSAGSNGMLYILKVGPDGITPLIDVEFTLYEADGITLAKDQNGETIQGKTDVNGKLTLLIPNPGLYQLKQTYINLNTYLPTTTVYPVRVADVKNSPTFAGGELVTSTDPLVVPTPITGKLTIGNKVEGNGADTDKPFKYTVNFSGEGAEASYPYTKSDGTSGTIKNGDEFDLVHDQKLIIPLLPKDLSYTVTETDYSAEGYTTEPEVRTYTDTIVGNGDHKADFVNKRMVYGTLLIDNTVTGNGGDKTKGFDYTVTFAGGGAGDEYTYTKTTKDGGTETGTLTSGGTVSLKDGEKLTMTLPKGLAYTVKQTDYTGEDYITTPSGLEFTGIIEQSQTAEAKFINHKDLPGNLLISNTVIGNGANPDKEFEYTVNFTGAGANRTYTYQYNDGTSGNITNGGKLLLKNGQSVTIIGILKDTSYTVAQQDYAGDQYTTDPASLEYTGVIKEDETAQALFENSRYLPGTLALEPKVQRVPGDGKTPAELTATLTGTDGKPVEGKVIVFKVGGTEIGRATTDKDGKATITYTPPKLTDTTPKEYEVTATTTATSPSGVPYNEDTAKVIAMPAALTGVLRDNTTGQIIPDADIVVKNVKTGEEFFIKTDSEGKYYHPVQRDEEYTITYSKMIPIGGVLTPVPFTQKGIIEGTDPTTEGNLIPAEITAVGIVLFKQPNGQNGFLSSTLAGNMHVYLKDASGHYIEENGNPKAFPLGPNGTFAAEGLSTGKYTLEVRYEFEPGKELRLIKDVELNVAANGELNISQELVDPYGIVYDASKGIATGQIEGATVTLYYADTDRNRNKGIIPGTKVSTLPTYPVGAFPPNDNKNPDQESDATGAYAYMVFPETDYYLVVIKSGYQTYTSPTISVEWDIVKYDVPMRPSSSGGSSGGSTPGDSNNGTDNGNPPGGENGTDNGNPPDGSGNGTDNGNPPDGNDNGNPPGGNNGINARPPKDDDLDDVPQTGDGGTSSMVYTALALIALVMLRIAMPFRRKKPN